MPNRTRRRAQSHRFASPWFVVLLLAACLVQGANGTAQQVPSGLGSISSSTSGQVDPNEFVLDAPPARVAAIAERYGLTVVRPVDDHGHGVYLVRGPAEGTSAELIATIASDPEVRHFELNALAIAPEVPGDLHLDQSPLEILDSTSDRTLVQYFGQQAWSEYATQTATTAIRVSSAHATVTGAGIVAIIDTGVDPTHPLLSGALVPGYDFVNDTAGQASEWTDLDPSTAATLNQSPLEILDAVPVSANQSTVVVLNSSTAQQLNGQTLPPAFGHGTMVAGLVHLVAPTAKIMPLKAFRADGSSRVFDIVRAIYYAVEHDARVINMSFSTITLSPEVAHAINFATDSGVICLSSAGNTGRDLLVYPAALRNVIGVGSTNSGSTLLRSTFTNYGDGLVRIGAPGEGVITTYPGGTYAGAWGTSFSTALASGAAALLVQKDPDIDQHRASDFLGKADKMPNTGMGRGRLNLYDAVRQLPDQTAPTVSVVTPVSGTTVQNTVTVSASASDNVGVVGVKFLLDNEQLGVEDTSAPYEVAWNTTALANGSHMLTAVARDEGGNQESASVTVTVANDTDAPVVSVTSPAANATVAGAVTLSANATDDIGVASVQFVVDGVAFGDADTAAPYDVAWTTTAVANGAHTITAVARDAAGHETTAAAITVTVANDTAAPTVSVTSPAEGATVNGTLTIAANASDDIGVTSVQFVVDGVAFGDADTTAPYEVSWTTTAVANGAHTITAVARDAAGHETTATTITVTVANDTTPPTVVITSPAPDDTVSGTVTLTANATDEVGVASVQFYVDGTAVGAADVEGPYEVSWSTAEATNGTHTITAVARDAAGNQTTSASVTVTVANPTND